ncbi:ABC transporter ATP-binding protein [Anaerocolumna sp. MB42-C2]|uniref:ABC transporter ATP-binding protein n=1 Tax=Anaerocolumna sp. MB42-C2 TaxID=3070997 RepID=UPI0027E03FA4|nr:ABC transporter ATP-binding protein [Anaerocolumna sp. MB42-C2]WMJ87281.1 ABC transporter ATP-binding protein [Anaerocolumna sp. MB42-C2]
MNKIELVGVDKTYGKEKPVIENLNLDIGEGSFTVLLGPSGCGKSTTLRMIAGLEKESGGDVYINGKSMKTVEPGDRDIAMVFQNYALYPTMTVKGNIEFGLVNNKLPKEERESRIQEIGEIVGLTEFMSRKPQSLSGGQRQRVALARAMVKKPSVFLMDEPLSNLDAKLRSQLRTELIELHHKLKTTFVYVTHDQVEAMSMGTEIVLMNQGRIMRQGTPVEIYNNPRNVFTAQFIGTPPMNILQIDKEDSLHIPYEDAGYVGFRPEHAKLYEGQSVRVDGLNLVGEVVTHEMLGSEVLYKIDTCYGRVNVKVFDLGRIIEGKVTIEIPKNRLYFFDEKQNRIFF